MKNRFFLFCLLAALAVSCVKDQQEVIQTITDDPVFYASIEEPGNPVTRVFADSQLRVLWNADDRVSIFNKSTYNRQYRFDGQDGDNSGAFKVVPNDDFVTSNPLDYVYSVYPYNENTKISNDGEITVYLPAEQSYRQDSFGLGANTMIAVTQGDELMFKNLCGYFAIKLYGDNVSVSSITLKGNNNESLAGKATVVAQTDAAPTIQFDAANAMKEQTLTCATPVTLGTTAETATTFWFVIPPTTFENGFTLTIVDESNCVFEKVSNGPLEIKRNVLKRSAALQVILNNGSSDNPEAIDLGLSVKWASCNIGAEQPEGYGDYFAWGEIVTYYEIGYAQENPQAHWRSGKESGYDWRMSNYSLYGGTQALLTKYCNYANEGTVDGKTVLDLTDDCANASLKGFWRIPTDAEWSELRENCSWIWTSENGVSGYRVSGNNQSIFLPASGYRDGKNLLGFGTNGLYWSSSLCMDDSYKAIDNYFTAQKISRVDFDRYYGLTIRPVFGEFILASSLSLNQSSLKLVEGESAQLEGVLFPEDCFEKNILWTCSDTAIVRVSNTGLVSAISGGTATVFAAWAGDPDIKAECLVSVDQNTIIDFDDANFESFCVNNYDTNGDGAVSFDEAQGVTNMVVCTDEITSLGGIEHFLNLQSLTCSGKTSDSEFGGSGKLSSIELSHNVRLNYLDCSNNQLQTLDLNDCQTLSTVKCSGNPLLYIDISQNDSIETLYAEDIDRLVVIFVPNSFTEASHPAFHKEMTAIYYKKEYSIDNYLIDDGFGQEINLPSTSDYDYAINFSGLYSITCGGSSTIGSCIWLYLYANETSQTIVGEMTLDKNKYTIIQKPVLLHNDAIYYRGIVSTTSASARIKSPSNCYDMTGSQLSIISRKLVPGNRCKIQYSGEVYAIGDNAFSVTSVGDGWKCQDQLSCIWLPYSTKEVGANSFSYTVSGQTLWQLCGFDRVDKVASYSFYGLHVSLSEYTYNYKMTVVPDHLFGRSIASRIIIPEGVTIIGAGAFGDSHNTVYNIVLPSTLTEIGNLAFGNTKPGIIFAYMTTPPDYSYWSYTYSEGTELHVPRGCGPNYTQWTNQVDKKKWTIIDDLPLIE